LIRNIAISRHHRPLVSSLSADPGIGIVHVRYNALHPGAERAVFPLLAGNGNRRGLVAFTATSWRQLLDPKRVPPGPANEAYGAEALRAVELGPMSPEELAGMRRVGDYIHN
jgi:hypothetical protein